MSLKAFNVGPCTLRSMPFWCVGNPLSDPFGGSILAKIDSLDVAKLLAEAAAGRLIEATSFHDDDLVPWNPAKPEDDLDRGSDVYKKLRQIKAIIEDAGLSVNTATCSLHSHPMFRNGGLTNPDRKIRAIAIRKVQRSIRIGRLFGARHFTYWVARDGFEVPVTVDWAHVYDWLAEGLNAATDYIKANKFTNYKGCSIEPKPNEPRGHMYLPTAGHAVGFIATKLKAPAFWGVNPELLQHESMALLNSVLTLGYLVSCGKLAFLHFGSQIKAQFDNDFPPLTGPEGLKETVQMFWALQQTGWKGVVEYDCHMLRTEGNPDDPIGCRKQFIRDCTTGLSIALTLAARVKEAKLGGLAETQADHTAIMAMCKVNAKDLAAMSEKR
jgi:xylose isomerase